MLTLRELRGHLIHQRHLAAAVYRDASHGPEQATQREEKPIFLHHETGPLAHRPVEQLAYQQVPVRCVRCHTDHTFVVVRYGHHIFPAQYAAENKSGKFLFQTHSLSLSYIKGKEGRCLCSSGYPLPVTYSVLFLVQFVNTLDNILYPGIKV